MSFCSSFSRSPYATDCSEREAKRGAEGPSSSRGRECNPIALSSHSRFCGEKRAAQQRLFLITVRCALLGAKGLPSPQQETSPLSHPPPILLNTTLLRRPHLNFLQATRRKSFLRRSPPAVYQVSSEDLFSCLGNTATVINAF